MVEKKRIKEWFIRDFIYIMVCLFAIFACLYTIYTVQEYQDVCNDHWNKQIDQCDCPWDDDPMNWTDQYSLLMLRTEDDNTNNN